MVLSHNTLDVFYRSPMGALPAGATVRLRVALLSGRMPERMDLRVWNGSEHCYPMHPLGARDGKNIYEVQLTVGKEPDLYWYRFEAYLDGEKTILGAPGDHTG